VKRNDKFVKNSLNVFLSFLILIFQDDSAFFCAKLVTILALRLDGIINPEDFIAVVDRISVALLTSVKVFSLRK